MTLRPAGLEVFIDAARAAYEEFATDPNSRHSVGRIFEAIDSSSRQINRKRVKLPVCAYLPEVATKAITANHSLGRLVEAFLAIEPELSWRRRTYYDPATASDNFHDGHGNCMVIGPGGYEDRSDLGLGVSLLAPNVLYPEHDHPPEETYLVASDGLFRQAEGHWFRPGMAGSFYNAPMIKHAMRSGKTPLLAFWALWMN